MSVKQVKLTVVVIILAFFAFFALAPFFFMLVSSFKPGDQIIKNGISARLDLDIMTFKNYKTLFTERNGIYLYWYKNSVLITTIQTAVAVFLSSLVGYGLAVYDFKGKNILFVLVLILMMVPIEILILPLYKLSITLKIIDTYAGVMLPFIVPPVAVFFFRQFAVGLPMELIDAARIDGASEFGIFFKIMMPLMKPAFGAMIILQAMFSWNAFVWPLIVLRSNENFTLPIGLASLITPYGNSYDMLFSGAVISVVPIIILFMFKQNSFISGLTVGGVKG
ncbi:carbohydrate ABC transporter permease [Halanaerobium salsuginis]|uniref:L-arabinose ABC transporter membrane protein n=1 Tax=Halanaerobium salsuginis TaxID=29563 RepID=A0A1I4K017_9FIRM|nr:carbohydrate ABC transporter permease [Halanaerobium salsuginis]SFL72125.1 L-arabinose ABC transporter membrane protein [Halanaerobium salsuginis]